MKLMSFHKGFIPPGLFVSILLTAIIALLMGFWLGLKGFAPQSGNPMRNILFTDQQASIRGKITKIQDGAIFVTNSDGKSGAVEAAEMVAINYPDKPALLISAFEVGQLEVNKEVQIQLLLSDVYRVTAITYLPSIPPPPRLNNEATPSNQLPER